MFFFSVYILELTLNEPYPHVIQISVEVALRFRLINLL